jgi:hypothetical protein
LTQLTEWGSDNFHDSAATDGIEGIAISPDGTKVAFTTGRIEFPLSPPTLITPALGQAVDPQLYVADLSAGTLQLVSYGYGGEPANGIIATPSFTGNGETLAFASSATNLVYGAFDRGAGDGAGSGDVFVTSQISSPAVAGVTYISPPPPDPVTVQPREILLATQPGANGSVLLYVTVPGAGSLKALAKAEVPETVTVNTKGKRVKGKAKTQRAVAGSAAKRSRQAKRTTVVSKTVASASAKPTQAGMVQLRLTPASAERALEESHDGLYATITVTFAARGSGTLTGTVQVTFKRAAPKPAKKKTATKKTSAKKSAKAESERTTAKQTTARTGA